MGLQFWKKAQVVGKDRLRCSTVQVPGKFFLHGCCLFWVPINSLYCISTALHNNCTNGNELSHVDVYAGDRTF